MVKGYSREYMRRYDGKEMNVEAIFETLYSYRVNNSGRTELAKFVDGSTSPTAIYSIVNSRCDCFGAARGECKHVRIKRKFEDLQAQTRVEGAFYCQETETFYVPEDGEGIPLEGVVQL